MLSVLSILVNTVRQYSVLLRYITLASVFMLTASTNLSFAADKTYQINKGDRLQISVWKEESLRAEVMVLPDGTITFPIVGTLDAAGKTLHQLQLLLEEKLEEYIAGPVVNVTLVTVDGNIIYVIGEVTRPGSFTMMKNLKVMQALSLAGGLTPFASQDDIHIIRETAEGGSVSIPFDYDDVEDGDDLTSNIPLLTGDTIVIP